MQEEGGRAVCSKSHQALIANHAHTLCLLVLSASKFPWIWRQGGELLLLIMNVMKVTVFGWGGGDGFDGYDTRSVGPGPYILSLDDSMALYYKL